MKTLLTAASASAVADVDSAPNSRQISSADTIRISFEWSAHKNIETNTYSKCLLFNITCIYMYTTLFNHHGIAQNQKEYKLDGGCSVSGDTLQYRLKESESVSHRRTRQLTQLFTYLLTHNLFSSCIWRYIVSRRCDWVMRALSAVLFISSFEFSLLFFNISLARPRQHLSALLILIRNIGRCRKLG